MSRGGWANWLVVSLCAVLIGAACSHGGTPAQVPPGSGSPPSPTTPPTPEQRPPVPAGEAQARSLLDAAVVAFDEGADDRSLALVIAAVGEAPGGTPTAQAGRYLLGRRLLAQGAFSAAATHLEAARSSDGDLGFYAAAALADAREGAGDSEGATSLRRELIADPRTPADVRDAVITAEAEGADPRDAADLARLASRPEALAAAIRALATGVAGTGLATEIARLVERFPASREAVEALGLAASLGIAVDPGIAGRALYRNGRLAEAINLLGPAIGDAAIGPDALALRTYYLAAAIDDSGRPLDSVPYYDSVQAYVPGDPLAYRAAYWAARALETAGLTGDASDRYVALVNAYPSGQFAAEAAFRAGFAWFEAGDPARAIVVWELAAPGADARTLYWKGRALEQTGRAGEARTSLEAAASDASTFYGEEAEKRLGGTARPAPVFTPLPARPPSDWEAVASWFSGRTGLARPSWEARTSAGALASLGLREDARRAIDAAATQTEDPGILLALVREADAAGAARSAIAILDTVLSQYPTSYRELPAGLQSVLYPIPLPLALEAAALTHGLDPLFLAALVRQESHWDPAAVSSAGALGLTQVLSSTGAQIAAELGVPFSPSDLFRPAVSLNFGAYYVAHQFARLGSPAAALAAYNGGPTNAARWAAMADPVKDPALFLEGIPFQETHGYVESVLTGYVRYRALARR